MLRVFPGRPAVWAALLVWSCASLTAQSDELAARSQYAKQLMAAGRFAEAVPVYQELTKALPGNTGLLLNLALAEHMSGQPRKAIPHFEAVLKAQPRNVPAQISLGAAYLEIGEPARAIDPLQRAAAADPNNTDARGMLAQSLLAAGRAKEAAAQFRKLTSFTPSDPKAWFGLGKSYEELSARAFEQLQKTAPESSWTLALLAESRVQKRQFRSAHYLYRQALEKNPGMTGVHAALADIYRKTGHPDWAAEEEKKEPAKATAPTPGPETFYRQTREFNRLALESFSKLAQLPESVEYHQLRGETMRAQGQHLESVKEWRAALSLQPGNPRLKRELAESLYLAADYHSAAPMLAELREGAPKSAELNFLEGDSLLHLEEVEQAIPRLETAARLDPQMTAAHASLGLAYARAGQPAKAIPHLRQALAVDRDGSLHYQLARAYQAAGEPDRAREAMAEYQKILKKLQQEKEELANETQITAPAPER